MLEGRIKACKDANFYVVSFEKNENKLPSGGWRPGSGELGQTSLILYHHLLCHSPNNLKNKTNKFLFNRKHNSNRDDFRLFTVLYHKWLASYG